MRAWEYRDNKDAKKDVCSNGAVMACGEGGPSATLTGAVQFDLLVTSCPLYACCTALSIPQLLLLALLSHACPKKARSPVGTRRLTGPPLTTCGRRSTRGLVR